MFQSTESFTGMCLQICVGEPREKNGRATGEAEEILFRSANAIPIASTDFALPLCDRRGTKKRVRGRVRGRFKWPVSRCSRHGCREADCNRVCSLAKKSHDTPPLSDWPRLFLGVHLIGSRKNSSMRKETAEERIASSVARLLQPPCELRFRQRLVSLPPGQRPASLLTWRASPPGARKFGGDPVPPGGSPLRPKRTPNRPRRGAGPKSVSGLDYKCRPASKALNRLAGPTWVPVT